MKSYHILDCENQQKIADSLYGYFVGITSNLAIKEFWNHLDRHQIQEYFSIPNNPCKAWFDSLGLKVRDMSFTLTTENISTNMHKDEPPVIAKVNFPVLNTRDTYNIWFDDHAREIDRVECTRPIVLRSDIFHTVRIGKTANLPRLQFSFCFYNEPLYLLK